jgi:hypothetical protein
MSTDVIAELERSEPKAFEGDLAVLPLPELMQFLHIGAKGGVLVVHDASGRPRAVLYYDRAEIIHATCDGIAGRDAVYAAMGFNSGRFEFFAGQVPRMPARTIQESVQNLILEGLRRIDELSHMARLLPDDEHPLYLAPEPPQDDIRLTAKEWRILSLVNGKRTIRQIIDAAQREADEVRAVLVALVTADLVVDRRDDSFLDAIVPRMLRQDEVRTTRYAPPTLVANLLLKRCDGKRTLRMLMADLDMDERAFLDEVKLLVRTHWLDFAHGADVFDRVAAE